MTLDQLLTNLPDLSVLRGLWLVMPIAQKDSILASQPEDSILKVWPIELEDGMFAVCADLLSEIGEEGLFRSQFLSLNPANFSLVEVLDDLPAVKENPGGNTEAS